MTPSHVEAVRVEGLVRRYPGRTSGDVPALACGSFSVARGSFVAVTGPSGSGKSTLMHLIGGLDQPTSGRVILGGTDLATLNERELSVFRRRELGFVFQFFNLLVTMNAWQNVALPLLLDGVALRDARSKAIDLLGRVGLSHREEHAPNELSGGELQRVAIARALVADPPLVLADEPTGNLDSVNGAEILDLLRATTSESGRTLILVTHDAEVAVRADRSLRLLDGSIDHDTARQQTNGTTADPQN